MFRYSLQFQNFTDGQTTKTGMIWQDAIFWGPAVHVKLIVVTAPVAIMITTIFIILVSFYRVRVAGKMDLKDIMSFNPTATPHIVAACCPGHIMAWNKQSLPAYKEMDTFSRDLHLQWDRGEDHKEGSFKVEVTGKKEG
jgi:hypothetical protein